MATAGCEAMAAALLGGARPSRRRGDRNRGPTGRRAGAPHLSPLPVLRNAPPRRPRQHRRLGLRSASKPNNATAAVGVFTDEKHELGEDVTVDFAMEASPTILSTSDEFDESKLKLPEFEDIVAAYLRIKNAIPRTPCWHSEALSRLTGMTIYLKGEHNQATGSFKERGARNAMLLLNAEQRLNGVVAASAGNHGLALSYHGRALKIPVTVVMPTTAPLTKISRCEALGANVVLAGKNFTEAFAKACELRDANSLTYINGYDDPPILAGAGTVGMEILEQVDELDAVVIPVGGGGLIAGMALAIKAVKPEIQVIGVEPSRVASFSAALHNGAPICIDPNGSTFADGLAVLKVGPHAFALARKYVDKVITIPEKDIGLGVLRLIEEEKVVTEGGGATAVGALVTGHLPELKGKRVAVVLSGGNIDITTLGRVIERGLAADRRLVHFSVVVSDKPGGLAALMGVVADERASVKDIVHERAWLDDDVMTTEVQIVAETMGEDHVKRLHKRLGEEMEKLDSLIMRWGSRTLL